MLDFREPEEKRSTGPRGVHTLHRQLRANTHGPVVESSSEGASITKGTKGVAGREKQRSGVESCKEETGVAGTSP